MRTLLEFSGVFFMFISVLLGSFWFSFANSGHPQAWVFGAYALLGMLGAFIVLFISRVYDDQF